MKRAFFTLALSLMGMPILMAHAEDGTVTKLELTPAKGRAIFVLSYEGEGAKFRMFQSEKQGNVVVEADGLMLPPRLSRALDGGKSSGPVIQLTPYSSANGGHALSKFVLQLRGKAEVTTSELPGKFVVEVRNKSGASTSLPSQANAPAAAGVNPIRPVWSETDTITNKDAASDKSEATARRLVETLNAPPEEKHYTGSPVTFEASNTDVHDVFRLLGDASGLNIVTDSDVKGTSSYTLKDIPWDQLLDIVVQQNQLKAKVNGNVVRIVSLEKFTKEQEDKARELSLADELEPVVMAVIPLSFAEADKMKKTIEALLFNRSGTTSSGTGTTPFAPSGSTGTANVRMDAKVQQDFVRGKIEIDARSNSLVVTNTRSTIERVRRLVKELDVALPQVLIDTKVVIASEQFGKDMGVSWGGAATSSGTGRAGFGATLGRAVNTSSGGTDLSAGGRNAAGASGGSGGGSTNTNSQFSLSTTPGQFLTGFKVGAGQHGNLTATLALSEVNSTSKTIASPRVIVNNNQEATITDGETITVQTTPGVQSAGILQSIKADLSLKVKPQVTSSGAVLLDVDIKKSAITGPSGSLNTSDKTIKTNVLVESGSTLVLGGVYQFSQNRSETGIPLLKDLPFIGQLFRTNNDSDNKQELMVFLTPQILDTNSSTFGAGAESSINVSNTSGDTGAM